MFILNRDIKNNDKPKAMYNAEDFEYTKLPLTLIDKKIDHFFLCNQCSTKKHNVLIIFMADTSEKQKKSNGKWIDFSSRNVSKQEEMDYTYSNIDKLVRLSLGENADFENALYNGDYSITLEEAQRRKNEFICDSLGITKATKVLDIGCGWGGFLKHIKEKGAQGLGVNLSEKQIKTCIKSGLNVYLKDARFIMPSDYGMFDAATAIGSFEHIASIDDYLNGNQDVVYDSYFSHIANLLHEGARFYMQSMVFSKNMIPYEDININAPWGSNAFIMGLMLKHFPNSWLPYGSEQIISTAAPYFKVIHLDSGRMDFIETNRQWKKRFLKFNVKKYLWFISLLPKYLSNREFRYQLQLLKIRPNRVCFEREIMDQSRIVFEKI